MCQVTEETAPVTKVMHESAPLEADYLVIGMGTAGMSFVDTLLTLDAAATVIMVDRNSRPGGHWTTAYPFVRLHQPSCNYGVNSLPLGKVRNSKGDEKFDIHDRATGREVAQYYERVADHFRQSGRVQLIFNSEHEESDDGDHTITNLSTGEVTAVSIGRKVVKIHTNLLVPSMRDGPPFDVHPAAKVVPVNDLPTQVKSGKYGKYVVIGAGKTGLDSITHLLQNGVDQSKITWVISRDVWYFLRDGYIREGKSYWQNASRLFTPLGKASTIKDAFLAYEKDGIMGRLDPINRPFPEVFKGATIDTSELEGFRTVKNVVRMGRVTSITNNSINLEQGSIQLSATDTLFVDCMADLDGSFYGYDFDEKFQVFEPGRINLGPLCTVFNPSFSSAIIAYIETTFVEDDGMKNSLLYFPRGKHATPTPSAFFGMLFAQMKTIEALGKYPPAMKFVLNSRTNADAPLHHGGTIKFLWGMFGPHQIAKKGNAFAKKVEKGGFADVQDCFGHGRPVPEADALKAKKNKGGNNKSKKMAVSYPPKAEAKKRIGFNCCTTINAVQ
uniref:Uncharacterized protein n=1 Tax=Pseudictyota dubia TaxID=2749911 RepID=A0A7R9ZH01_9STRA|mmetsp:Transcript_8175/g.14985  ORF Transcript_8175/g.14985 Transcript_8175/m.14985 type:complete len:556 (+) Transcript_8175:223-1890(+)|eukprot:CAMPEP_0197446858 /NCGR_PEP_ID=MMETSP1175-20131217/11684_1 /TAXON_ID=1003142 /ORGANISM="Triceratium dubium, Strain CCMP147" /LENGTH=555 /DNA_ID=CAMNT_0042978023 /DNA_START=223 /DNA_END=1890 /DNA_ORIENTATION=-